MFKRLFLLMASVVILLSLTFFNYDNIFSGKKSTYYKGTFGSTGKEVKGTFNFLGSFGESARLTKEEVENLFYNLSPTLLVIEEVGETTNYYCYTNDLKSGVRLKNQVVNLHISESNGVITVGTPIIFGSF